MGSPLEGEELHDLVTEKQSYEADENLSDLCRNLVQVRILVPVLREDVKAPSPRGGRES